MSIKLPTPIADYVAANARLDADAMLRPFAADAVLPVICQPLVAVHVQMFPLESV